MEREQATELIHNLLRGMLSKKASDLFITAGFPPAFKMDGKLTPVSNQALTPTHTQELARSIMNDRQAAEFEATHECNFAISPHGIGRFRVNVFMQQQRVGMVLRTITTKIPDLDQMGMPPILKDIVMTKRGLVIVVGGTGSGKSTTLAGMIGHRNKNSYGHIITIEDPVEYVHEHINCMITHREVGVDTDSWHNALKNTLRQAPDGFDRRIRDHRPWNMQWLCRNRPLCGAARQQCNPGTGPYHQLFPGRASYAVADGCRSTSKRLFRRLIPKKTVRGAPPR